MEEIQPIEGFQVKSAVAAQAALSKAALANAPLDGVDSPGGLQLKNLADVKAARKNFSMDRLLTPDVIRLECGTLFCTLCGGPVAQTVGKAHVHQPINQRRSY